MGDEMSPGGGKARQRHPGVRGTGESFSARGARELLITDVGRIPDHRIDRSLTAEERARWLQRKEALGAYREGYPKHSTHCLSGQPRCLGIQIDGVDLPGGPLGTRPELSEALSGELDEDAVAARGIQDRGRRRGHRPGYHRSHEGPR